MGFGIFLMTRKQMLGLKARAERGESTAAAQQIVEPTPA
jgi:hypothetical protein